MVNTVVYYGLSLNTSNLGGDDYVNFAIAGAVEIPGYLLSYVALKKLGRRLPQAIAMVSAGLVLLATIPIPQGIGRLTLHTI
jgi:OCT family organic cation transporter-like MFS transporter 4/5